MPVTVLRPGATYGPGDVHPREFFFIKRALDHRRVQLLNWNGQSRFHLSNTRNIAKLVRLDHHPKEFLIPGPSTMGNTPWAIPSGRRTGW